MEIWKDIEGYENSYQVSNFGQVRTKNRLIFNPLSKTYYEKNQIILKQYLSLGYKRTILCKNGKSKNAAVHRLVAQTFIPNPENKPQVNHINGIKTDNRIENLEWCTASENGLHAYKTGLNKPTYHKRDNLSITKLKETDVLNIKKLYNGNNITYIKTIYNVNYSTIYRIIHGRKYWKKHKN